MDDKGIERFACWDVQLNPGSLAAWINELEAKAAAATTRQVTGSCPLCEANARRAEVAETAYQRDSAAWHELQDTLVRQRDEALRQAEADAAAWQAKYQQLVGPGHEPIQD
jgi:hypothetical protein